LDSFRTAQGLRMTGCGTSSWTISPRWIASCCLHQGQIFLKLNAVSCLPHRMHFAMSI
jgi:hypothetical protein